MAVTFPSIKTIDQEVVGTAQAAHYLNRKEGTLRLWACKSTGPIAPRNIGGRLAWPVAEIRKLLGVV
jgi:hypothetical protein